MDIISVQKLSKEYVTYKRGSSVRDTLKSLFVRERVIVKAVDEISFSVKEGIIAGMLGPNGAGKSTTIKMLTGILTPTSGNIDVMGLNPHKQRTRYVQGIGAMFGQKSQLIWDIPPLDAFLMNKAIYNIDTKSYNGRLEMLTELLSAGDIISKPTRVLSLGERMKCEFIIAMLHGPRVVFLDEPTIGLDVIAKDSIRSFIKDMNKQGVTFILTTHDLGDIESLAHTAVIIDKGSIVFDGSISELKRYLGNKKTVSVTTVKPLDTNVLTLQGVSLTGEEERRSILSVDLEQVSLNEFIAVVSKENELTDLSVTEPQMDEIVRTIYSGKNLY